MEGCGSMTLNPKVAYLNLRKGLKEGGRVKLKVEKPTNVSYRR